MTHRGLAALVGVTMWLAGPGAAARADSGNVLAFTVAVAGVNPCNAENVSGSLNVTIVLNRHSAGDDETRANVHGSFHGELTGSLGNTYHVAAEGEDHSDLLAGHYDFPFHVNAATEGSAPNLTLDGIARVIANASGDPVGA